MNSEHTSKLFEFNRRHHLLRLLLRRLFTSITRATPIVTSIITPIASPPQIIRPIENFKITNDSSKYQIMQIPYELEAPKPERQNQQSGTYFYIDQAHATYGRLYNLYEVSELVNGRIIQPGETLSLVDVTQLQHAERYYMPAKAYDGSLTTAYGGGVCGFATAMVAEAEKLGLTVSTDGAIHPDSDHRDGGIYAGLPNVAISAYDDIKDVRITNNTGKPLIINIKTNFTLNQLFGKINLPPKDPQYDKLSGSQIEESGMHSLDIIDLGYVPFFFVSLDQMNNDLP